MFLTIYILSLAVWLTVANPVHDAERQRHPDTGLNVIEMIERQGYPVERHQNIKTEDGYLLEIQRIPHGKNNQTRNNRPVVLLMHGLTSSSADWVNMGPDYSISYQLVEAGYDVWLGNARGNMWSRKHVTLNPDKDNDFWKFSWNEIGVYDLPATIDYILETTNQESLFYIGHSQGTTAFFVMTSEKPEYNKKIRLMSALAPVAYMSNMDSKFCQLLAKFQDQLDWITKFVGMYEFLPHSELMELIGQAACNDDAPLQEVCSNIVFLICGYDSQELNASFVPVITTNLPAGCSTRQFLHYAQEITSKKFRKYDYGSSENLDKYGQISPPDYDLNKITAPIALYYGSNDRLTAVEDVEQLSHELPHVAYKYLIPYEKFNHLDFLWAADVRELLYNRVLELMSKY